MAHALLLKKEENARYVLVLPHNDISRTLIHARRLFPYNFRECSSAMHLAGRE